MADMWTSIDVTWKPKPQFSMLVHPPGEPKRKFMAWGSWFGSRIRRSPSDIFGSQMVERWIPLHILVCSSARDVNKIIKYPGSKSLISNLFLADLRIKDKLLHNPSAIASGKGSDSSIKFVLRDQVIEEPWLLQSSLPSHCTADSDASAAMIDDSETSKPRCSDTLESKVLSEIMLGEDSCSRFQTKENPTDQNHNPSEFFSEYDQPVEEPWLFQSSIEIPKSHGVTVSSVLNENCTEDLDIQQVPDNQHHLQILEEPLPDEEHANSMEDSISTVMNSVEDSISTVILINSSICTMQRIAVLENGELVELLLEPVKNNVQCDSVYLGVVTKLVPHMGGAFVNIGSPRPSLMDIKPNREPFVFPPYRHRMKEREVNGSPFSSLEQQTSFFVKDNITDVTENSEEIEDDEIDEDSFEYTGDDLEHENGDDFDILEFLKENSNGGVAADGVPADCEGHLQAPEDDVSQLQSPSVQHHVSSDNITCKDENKWAQVRKGTKIIVQVVKEGLGTKGPTLTAYPKLKSRFWILMTRCNTIGISKKISGVERTRLRVIAKTLQPPGFGLTVRTVASGHSMEELQKDLDGLLSTWKVIMEHAKSAALAADEGVDGAIPVMLHQAMGQTLSVVQDYFTDKVKSLVVDSPRTYHEVTNYVQEIAPNLCERVELYSRKTPLFDEYNIEKEIDSILSKRVSLANGGYLVIEQTEALVSIDVNGGHCMLGHGTSQEKAILEVNLAAAKQIARELRLRDIGGIIVVDFIDMLDDSNKRLVYEEVKKAVERDRSMVKVSELSRHGLMEITRKRVRPTVTFMISEPCTCCHATGRVEALETSFSKIEHEICRLLSLMDHQADPENPKSWPRFMLMVDRYMCNYLTSGKRTRLAVLSSSLKVWILLKVARGFTRGAFELKPLNGDKELKNHHQAAISMLRPTETRSSMPNKKVTIFPIKKKWKTGGK